MTAWATDFTRVEWCIVLMLIGMVYTAEVFNTAVEKLMDHLHPEHNPEVGHIKDLAAGGGISDQRDRGDGRKHPSYWKITIIMKKTMPGGKLFLYIGILLSALVFVLPTSVYEFDLLQSFAVHALAGYLALTWLLVLFRQWFLSMSAGGAAGVLLLFLSPFVLPSDPALTTEGQPFTVAHFNVLRSNRNYDATIRQALASRADLLSFQEVNQRWANQLTPRLCEEYPYYHVTVETAETQGLAVFSRYPLKEVEVRYWVGTPNIVGTIELTERGGTGEETIVGDTTVHFVASHTLSPRSERRYRRRNEHIRQDCPLPQVGRGPGARHRRLQCGALESDHRIPETGSPLVRQPTRHYAHVSLAPPRGRHSD